MGELPRDPCSQGTDSTDLLRLIISGPQSVWMSPSPTRALLLEPGSSFLPRHAPHAELLLQLPHFAQESPLGGHLEYWLIPGVLASLTQGQLASFQASRQDQPPLPNPTPIPCQLPRFLPLGRCLSRWHAVSLHEGLMHVQTPGAGTLPAASLLGSDPGSLALNSGEVGNPTLGSNTKCTEVCPRLHQGDSW